MSATKRSNPEGRRDRHDRARPVTADDETVLRGGDAHRDAPSRFDGNDLTEVISGRSCQP
jgi:hypothetical protein